MVRPADLAREGALMVELKGIEPPFPLYGDFKLAGGRSFDHSLLANHGAVVAPLLLERLQLKVGDKVKIGESTFEIRGQFEREPGGGGGFRLGPRVFIERGAVEATGLVGFGSRARRRILLQDRRAMENVVQNLRNELKGQLVTVNSYRDSQENLSEQFSRTENYLSLTGLIVLVLGGVGVSSVTRVFIEQKKKTIAVLKCIGGTGGDYSAYLAQVIALGAGGEHSRHRAGKGCAPVSGKSSGGKFAAEHSYGLHRAVAQGLGLGLLISILFAALPLLRIRHIKPNMLLREYEAGENDAVSTSRAGGQARRDRGARFLASWQAGSLRVGSFFWRAWGWRRGSRGGVSAHACQRRCVAYARSRSGRPSTACIAPAIKRASSSWQLVWAFFS